MILDALILEGNLTLGGSFISGVNTITLPSSTDTIILEAFAQTLTNKTISGASNTLSNIATTSLTGTLQAAQFPALTGDVTNSAGSLATTISSGVVSNAKLASIATQTFKGRTTAGSGVVEDLTATQATAILNVFGPDTGSGGVKGLVPATISGDATKYLRGDGTWVTISGSGTVTSVSVVSANGVSGSVATATTTPAITLTLGAITPTSVAASGSVTGSNLSGANTGDQTITLTGDITGSGTSSFATTLATVNLNTGTIGTGATQTTSFTVNGKGLITAASATAIQIAESQVTGLTSDLAAKAASGANTDITSILLNQTGLVIKGATANTLTIKPNETYSSNKILNLILGDTTRTLTLTNDASIAGTHSGTSSGTNTGDQTITLTGDVTGSGTSSFAATIANNAVTDAKIASHTSTKITITAKGQLNSAIVYNDQANTYGDFDQIFRSSRLIITNPANTNNYTFVGSAITAARQITIPLISQTETMAVQPQISLFTPTDPTGTSSATAVMMGLGSTLTLTPRVTGRIKITITGRYSMVSAGSTMGPVIRYGTGTAPANAAAASGTTASNTSLVLDQSTANEFLTLSITGLATSLTLGTAYWFDVSLIRAGTSNTVAISTLTVILEEI